MSSPPSDPGRDSAGVRVPPPLIYALALAAGFAAQRARPAPWLPPRLALGVGVMLLAAGLACGSALLAFRRARTRAEPWLPSRALVTDGPYRYSRNPMYVGFTLIYLGVAAAANSAWPLLFLPLVLVVMRVYVIRREERYLTRRFGEEYTAYRARVRRWV